jgi:PilZ domain-containing protein
MRIGDLNKRAHRVDLRQPAVLMNSDGVESNVFILDVSSGGFRLEISESLRVGELVTLRVERCDDFPAQIRWALGNEAGGVFLSRADFAEWKHAKEATMVPHDTDQEGDRRKGEDRREGEQRRQGQRRQGGRTADRRQGDRREGERRE